MRVESKDHPNWSAVLFSKNDPSCRFWKEEFLSSKKFFLAFFPHKIANT